MMSARRTLRLALLLGACVTTKTSTSQTILLTLNLPAGLTINDILEIGRVDIYLDESPGASLFATDPMPSIGTTDDGYSYQQFPADIDGDGKNEWVIRFETSPFGSGRTWSLPIRGSTSLEPFYVRGIVYRGSGPTKLATAVAMRDANGELLRFGPSQRSAVLAFACEPGVSCGSVDGGDAGAFSSDAGDGGGVSDAGTDAGADAGADTGADAGADTGADAGADAGPDAGPPPNAPTNLDAGLVGERQVLLTWLDNAADETGFAVERKTGSGGSYSQIATTPANAVALDASVPDEGTQYTFRVAARRDASVSTASNEASVTTGPNAPSGLATTAPSSTTVSLQWTDNSAVENSFHVERSTDGGAWSAVATLSTDSNSWTNNTGLSPGTYYSYRVRAGSTAYGDSYNSNSASIWTWPSPPTGLATQPSDARVVLSWDASVGAVSYTVLRSTDAGGGFTVVVTDAGPSFLDTGLANGTAYYYTVRASNPGGTSGDSALASAQPFSLDLWTQRRFFPAFSAIAHQNGSLVGVGDAGLVATSSDGFTWRRAPTDLTNDFHAVAWGDAGTAVAAGSFGKLLVSHNNGVTWADRTITGLTSAYRAIAYGNGSFNAVAADGRFIRSTTEGESWTYGSQGSEKYNGLAYGNGVFVAVGDDGGSRSSTDNGTNWTGYAMGTEVPFYGVTHLDGGTFVAVGQAGKILTSTNNGQSWAGGTPASPTDLRAISNLGSNTLVAVGAAGGIWRSANGGSSWAKMDAGTGNDLSSIARISLGNVYVAGTGGVLLVSYDMGENWGVLSTTTTVGMNGVTYGGGSPQRFVAVGRGGRILRSDDGVTWTRVQTTGTTNDLNAVGYGGGLFVAVGRLKTVVVSSDNAVTWSNIVVNDNVDSLTGVAYTGTAWVATALDGGVISSTAPLSVWTVRSSGITNDLYAIAANASAIVGAGSDGKLIRSVSDGTSWTQPYSATSWPLFTVAFGNDTFVALGEDGARTNSTNNGQSWSPGFSSLTSGKSVGGVAYGGGSFVFGAFPVWSTSKSGEVYSSSNGTSWTYRDAGTFEAIRAAAYGNGRFVVVGDNDAIWTAP